MIVTRPQLWVVGGPNGAGKTTLVTSRIKTTLVTSRIGQRIPVVNPDEIADTLPMVGGVRNDRQAGAAALHRRAMMLQSGEIFAIETTLTGASPLRFIAEARRAGYKVTLVFVGLDDGDLSIQRVADRVQKGGHPVPISAIVRRYPASIENFARAIRPVDRAYLLDNTGARRRLLAVLGNGRLRYQARKMPDWARRALTDVPDA